MSDIPHVRRMLGRTARYPAISCPQMTTFLIMRTKDLGEGEDGVHEGVVCVCLVPTMLPTEAPPVHATIHPPREHPRMVSCWHNQCKFAGEARCGWWDGTLKPLSTTITQDLQIRRRRDLNPVPTSLQGGSNLFFFFLNVLCRCLNSRPMSGECWVG